MSYVYEQFDRESVIIVSVVDRETRVERVELLWRDSARRGTCIDADRGSIVSGVTRAAQRIRIVSAS